jgi:hypothetical protein
MNYERIVIALIAAVLFWFLSKSVMKNDFKKNIKFFPFIKSLEDKDEKILSIIFSIISIAIPIIIFIF